jgi:hypothetical protein
MRVQSKQGSAAGFTPKVHKQTVKSLSAIEPLLISGPQENDMDRKQKGFSLIELLGVIRYTPDDSAPTIASPPLQ